MEAIIKLVSIYCDVSHELVTGPGKKKREVSDARAISMLIIKERNDQITTTQIGRMYSNRGRSSVLNNLRQAEALVRHDAMFRAKYTICENVVENYLYI